MSVRVMADVWDAGPEDAVDRSVLLALANHCDDDGGSCFPAEETVAQMVCRVLKTIQRSIQSLEAAGWIEVERGGGRGLVSSYTVNVDKLAERAAVVRAVRAKRRHRVAVSAEGKGRLCVLKKATPATEKATPATEKATPASSYKEDPSGTHQGTKDTPQPPSRGDGGVELPAMSREEFLADLALANRLRARMIPPKPPFREDEWREILAESHREAVRKAAAAEESAQWEQHRTKAGRLRWRRRGS